MPSKRLPRDLDARDLVRALARLKYEPVRQTGSHIRMKTQRNGEHHTTIPCHSPLKVGTLSSILSELSVHHQMSRSELLSMLEL